MIYLLICALALSLSLNAYLYIKLRKSKKVRALSETREFFRHLSMYGNGVLRVQVLDPAEIMVRSPR